MKTVKLFTTLLMVVLCVGITSCSKDDDNETSIVGTWNMSKTISGRASLKERVTTYPDANNQSTLTLNSDGSFSSTDTEDGKTELSSGIYTYDPAKNLLTMTYKYANGSTETSTLTVKELTVTSLVISNTLVEEDEYYEVYLNRK
jgi:hypothetical protein